MPVVDDGIGGDHSQRVSIGDDENPLPVRQGLPGHGPGASICPGMVVRV